MMNVIAPKNTLSWVADAVRAVASYRISKARLER